MMREEFEKLIGKEVGVEDYEIIEHVYAFHPCIDAVKGKRQIANIYLLPGGMRIIKDMVATADAAEEIDNKMMAARHAIDEFNRELNNLRMEREKLAQ